MQKKDRMKIKKIKCEHYKNKNICKKSSDGDHCWHRIASNVVIIGKTVMDDVCCFCGETKHIEMELPSSYTYSYDASKHGPFAPVYRVLY